MHFCCAADSQLADVSEIPASTLPSHHIKHLITTKYLLLIYSIFIGKTEYIFKDQEDISLKWLLNLIMGGCYIACMEGSLHQLCLTVSLLSFSLFRMSSTSSLALSRSCRSLCHAFSCSFKADCFSSLSRCDTSLRKPKKHVRRLTEANAESQ